MRYFSLFLCLASLACGSSQPESPLSQPAPRPSAQQAEPTAAAPPAQPVEREVPSPAPGEPSTPRTPALDGSTPAQPAQPQRQPSAASTSCKVDADCEAVDDMCGACRCLPLSKGSAPPACQEPKVQCVMAPCRGKRPVCKSGTCALIDASNDTM